MTNLCIKKNTAQPHWSLGNGNDNCKEMPQQTHWVGKKQETLKPSADKEMYYLEFSYTDSK